MYERYKIIYVHFCIIYKRTSPELTRIRFAGICITFTVIYCLIRSAPIRIYEKLFVIACSIIRCYQTSVPLWILIEFWRPTILFTIPFYVILHTHTHTHIYTYIYIYIYTHSILIYKQTSFACISDFKSSISRLYFLSIQTIQFLIFANFLYIFSIINILCLVYIILRNIQFVFILYE